MSFMSLYTYQGKYWLVSTDAGRQLVPFDVTRLGDGLADFVEGTIEGEPEACEGWYGRYSADGYMDATSWCWAETEEELVQILKTMFPLGDEDSE